MAWDRGYYYLVRKEGGRVIREYVGKGPLARSAALVASIVRQRREAAWAARRAAEAELDDLDALPAELDRLADRLARAALLAAGYHQRKRTWRKRRRGKLDPTEGGARDAGGR
jgi:hypothetical protein